MKRPNAWHEAICEQLRQADGPLLIDQIWNRLNAIGFRHTSTMPRYTLTARITELVRLGKIERVRRATYRMTEEKAA